MRPLHYYLVGTSGWFVCNGIQTVMFAWLVTIVLHESPRMVGVAQTAMLVPAMLLMLVGGSVSDRYGGRRVAVLSQVAATVPVLALWVVLSRDSLTFGFMIAFAVAMGCAQAFLTPARDGLLNQVAGRHIQRTVALVTLVQFGIQIVAFLVAGQADRIGAGPVVLVQVAALVVGTVALTRVAVPAIVAPPQSGSAMRELARSVADGARTVLGSPSMRAVVLQNFAMGIFFMGPYVVAIPLLVRETYDGSASDLAWLSSANAVGLIAAVCVLLMVGEVRRPGRLLLLSTGVGSVALGLAGLGLGFSAFVLCIGAWGSCAGLGMSMARMIMQERAPRDQRGRVMAFFSFSFMSSAPLGTMLSGLMVEWWGAERGLIVSALAMLAAICAVGVGSRLWWMDARVEREAGAG